MASLNKAMIIGRLGRDPEMRYTASGLAIANFSVATSEKRKDQDEKTEWHNVVAFDKLAEICGKYLVKGKLVFIEGRLQTSDWVDKDDNKRYKTEIIAYGMQMLDGKNDAAQAPAGGSGGGGGRPAGGPPPPSDDGVW